MAAGNCTDKKGEIKCPFGNGNYIITGAKWIADVENKLKDMEDMTKDLVVIKRLLWVCIGAVGASGGAGFLARWMMGF